MTAEREMIEFDILYIGAGPASLSSAVRWMAKEAEKLDINILTEFAGMELIYEGDACSGVRCGDKGLDRDGSKRSNYGPGMDIKSKITVLGEGARGSLAEKFFSRPGKAAGNKAAVNPQVYSLGVKEILEVSPAAFEDMDDCTHTMGWPLFSDMYGGSFFYKMNNNRVCLGLVTSLEYRDPKFDLHKALQLLKSHPLFYRFLKGAKTLYYGTKTMPVGGYYSVPRLYDPGLLVIGDSAGLLNSLKLKGIHLAIESGILSAPCRPTRTLSWRAPLAKSFTGQEISTSPLTEACTPAFLTPPSVRYPAAGVLRTLYRRIRGTST